MIGEHCMLGCANNADDLLEEVDRIFEDHGLLCMLEDPNLVFYFYYTLDDPYEKGRESTRWLSQQQKSILKHGDGRKITKKEAYEKLGFQVIVLGQYATKLDARTIEGTLQRKFVSSSD